jgi:hypothetical protein
LFANAEYRQALVQGFYQRFLHRAADPAGLRGFSDALQSGMGEDGVLAAIVGSEEYFSG